MQPFVVNWTFGLYPRGFPWGDNSASVDELPSPVLYDSVVLLRSETIPMRRRLGGVTSDESPPDYELQTIHDSRVKRKNFFLEFLKHEAEQGLAAIDPIQQCLPSSATLECCDIDTAEPVPAVENDQHKGALCCHEACIFP